MDIIFKPEYFKVKRKLYVYYDATVVFLFTKFSYLHKSLKININIIIWILYFKANYKHLWFIYIYYPVKGFIIWFINYTCMDWTLE